MASVATSFSPQNSAASTKAPTNTSPTRVRRNYPRVLDKNSSKNRTIVKTLHNNACEKRCTAEQLALAWLLTQGDDVFPIPG
ncbi:uncharacterized protein BCR38DRAFT_345849 [Pseudomassariella vexata]|uniref:NADP-dependent oxidoreductase domain-containing protein n=1 Tax=Pseudomassariella vexata TaxID=1141098 RepID=A0A1Y2DSC1_9PEZI|nr:uncharacterized protein BCR38DRAFT_345849 [Pseudomassariella vexata]ORY62171.1 hypothetical protein BCR38DRAFT_345849 [Pseudomassariella vexata]